MSKRAGARWRCHGNPFICCQYVDLPTCNSTQETHWLAKLLNISWIHREDNL